MPSTSTKQLHFMHMVKAMQHGHEITGIDKGTRADVHQAAASMSARQVEDFQTLQKPTPRTLLSKKG